MKFKDPLPRFYSRIHKADNGCWLWTGASVQGRGQISVNGRTILATRFSYEHFKEPIPAGMFVCHTCDVPACVNPDHLWLGTARDNVQDALKKNRLPQSAKQGVCLYGHAFDGRECGECKQLRDRKRDYGAERKAAREKSQALIVRLQERVAELEAALRKICDTDSDMGMYPKAVSGCAAEKNYEQRDGYKNGWNAAVMEYGHTLAVVAASVGISYTEREDEP